MNERLKEFSKEVVQEKAGKDTATKTAKDKIKAIDVAEKRAAVAEKDQALVEKRLAKLTTKQNKTNLKLAKAASLNMALNKELADLRAALEACEKKMVRRRIC